MRALRLAQGKVSFLEDFVNSVILTRYQKMKRNRYISRPPCRTGLSPVMFEIDLQEESGFNNRRAFLSDAEFLQKYRMSRKSFSKLVSLLEDHPAFSIMQASGQKQVPFSHQLMVFLKYLGTEGGGNSNNDLQNMFHTGRGTNEVYKARISKAIRSLQPLYYQWPDVQERKRIHKRIRRICGLPNCVGFIDGTMNPLSSKPRRPDAADYFGRKQRYALSTLVICNDRRLIRYYLAGWPGSCHDNLIYRNSSVACAPSQYFSVGESIVGDSAFEPSTFVVPAFKKPNGHTIPRDYENFNKRLSTGRVISEHTIGIWKARFPWLRKIPLLITDNEDDSRRLLGFIECSVILHNFLVTENEGEVPQDWMDDDDICHLNEGDELNRPIADNAPKDSRQQQVMNFINEQYFL